MWKSYPPVPEIERAFAGAVLRYSAFFSAAQ